MRERKAQRIRREKEAVHERERERDRVEYDFEGARLQCAELLDCAPDDVPSAGVEVVKAHDDSASVTDFLVQPARGKSGQ